MRVYAVKVLLSWEIQTEMAPHALTDIVQRMIERLENLVFITPLPDGHRLEGLFNQFIVEFRQTGRINLRQVGHGIVPFNVKHTGPARVDFGRADRFFLADQMRNVVFRVVFPDGLLHPRVFSIAYPKRQIEHQGLKQVLTTSIDGTESIQPSLGNRFVHTVKLGLVGNAGKALVG